jgi:hypothetical protein
VVNCWLLQRRATSSQTGPSDSCLSLRSRQEAMSLQRTLQCSTQCSVFARHKRKLVPLIYFRNYVVRVEHGSNRSLRNVATSNPMPQVWCSNLGRDTIVFCEDLHGFTQSIRVKIRIVTQVGHNRFILKSFHFIIYQSPYNCMRYSRT